MDATAKTETQLQQEIAALFREIGARTYSRHLVDREIGQLNEQLFALNLELHNRRQARAMIEAEAAAAASTQLDQAAGAGNE